MDGLRIETNETAAGCKPGGQITGTIHWQLSDAPERFEIALFWRTEGKGTQDVGVEQVQQIENPDSQGQQEFCFTLPVGPYSLSSRFLSLVWALEVSDAAGEMSARRDFSLSPTGAEIVLPGSG